MLAPPQLSPKTGLGEQSEPYTLCPGELRSCKEPLTWSPTETTPEKGGKEGGEWKDLSLQEPEVSLETKILAPGTGPFIPVCH